MIKIKKYKIINKRYEIAEKMCLLINFKYNNRYEVKKCIVNHD